MARCRRGAIHGQAGPNSRRRKHRRVSGGAGFGDTTPGSMKVTAHRVFHDPRMLAALDELGREFLRGGVPDALGVVYEIMGDERHKDRLKAAQVIINYAHPVQTAHHVTVEHVDDRRMVDFALKLAAEMGVEAGKLVGGIDRQVD
jgi:hypothetical protein